VLFDSFQGLPKGHADDREASKYAEGDYAGSLEEVRAEIKLATRRAVGIPESAMRLIQALRSPRFVEAWPRPRVSTA
jgi:hypothetical protein